MKLKKGTRNSLTSGVIAKLKVSEDVELAYKVGPEQRRGWVLAAGSVRFESH